MTRVVVCFAAVCALLAAVAPEALAWRGLATITGTVQGKIEGDNTTKDGPGAVVIREIGFDLSLPIDVATGLPAGKVRFAPFTVVKEPDRATPKLLRAAATLERLTVEIRWFRSVATGAEQHYFTVRLENALISQLQSEGDVTVAGGVLESVRLTYGKLTMTDVINGIETVVSP